MQADSRGPSLTRMRIIAADGGRGGGNKGLDFGREGRLQVRAVRTAWNPVNRSWPELWPIRSSGESTARKPAAEVSEAADRGGGSVLCAVSSLWAASIAAATSGTQ
jgi:hypothetical protein